MVAMTPSKSTAITRRHCSASMAVRPPPGSLKPGSSEMPALANTTSSPPYAATAPSISASTCPASATSTTCVRTSPSSVRPSSAAASRSASVTRAPACASTSAMANPSPLAAPVTTTRVPRTSNKRSAFMALERKAQVARGGVRAIGRLQLAQHVLDVELDRALGDHERAGDLAVGLARGHQLQDVLLARREVRHELVRGGRLAWLVVIDAQLDQAVAE